MSQQPSSSSKKLLPWLLVVLVAAVALSVSMVLRARALRDEVDALSVQLSESQAAWQAIDAEKQINQSELTAIENALREAQLTLDESTQKAKELGVQVADLEEEKAALASQTDLHLRLNGYVIGASDMLSAALDTVSAVKNDLSDAQTELEATRERLLNVENELNAANWSMQTFKDETAAEVQALQAQLEEAQSQLVPLRETLSAALAAQKEALIALQDHYHQAMERDRAALASTTDENARQTLSARIETLSAQMDALQTQIDALP